MRLGLVTFSYPRHSQFSNPGRCLVWRLLFIAFRYNLSNLYKWSWAAFIVITVMNDDNTIVLFPSGNYPKISPTSPAITVNTFVTSKRMLNVKTAFTIANNIVHSKLDFCIFRFLYLDSTQIKRLQFIQNSFARVVTRAPRHHHVTPVLKMIATERIHFKAMYLTFMYNCSTPCPLTCTFSKSSPFSQPALPDHPPVSPFSKRPIPCA